MLTVPTAHQSSAPPPPILPHGHSQHPATARKQQQQQQQQHRAPPANPSLPILKPAAKLPSNATTVTVNSTSKKPRPRATIPTYYVTSNDEEEEDDDDFDALPTKRDEDGNIFIER